jgi:hypothetical protein
VKKLLSIVALTLLSAAPAAQAVSNGGVVVTYSESLQNLSMQAAVAQEAPGIAPGIALVNATLEFDALGQRFELALEPNTRLVRGRLPAGIGVYRGRLAGKPDSWARITMVNGAPTGLIFDGAEMLAIDASAAGATIYRLADTYVESGTLSCGVPGEIPKATSLATAYAAVTGELDSVVSQAPGAVEEIRVGIVSDFEFTSAKGTNTEAEILTRMNNVDGIFSSQLAVQITVEVIETFSNSDDPFTSTVPGDLLDELADYRAITPVQFNQGLTFMFTGRDLDGMTAGIAYRGALCSRRFGVGLSEGVRNAVTDSLIAAHEIGHNFGAEHDGEAGSVCESVVGDFLMSPSVNGSDQFSSCSINTMQASVNLASCITPLAATDVGIQLTNAPANWLLGTSPDLIFDISNGGSQTATNVAATFSLPTNLTLGSVATTVGSCTSGAGQVNCNIGTLGGGSSASVAVSVTASSTGSGTLGASVVADDDANLNDNSLSVPVTVVPATDLRVANAVSRTVALNGTVALSPRIDNASTLDATSVALTVSHSAGLRVDSASWPNGTCSIGTGSVTCQRAILAAGASVSLDIQFTVTAGGSQTYTVSASSSEPDSSTGDNSRTGTITVSGGGGSDGGGGTFGLLWSLLAATVVALARSRRA